MPKVIEIPVKQVEPYCERERDEEKFRNLCASIKRDGQILPAIVAPAEKGSRYKYRLVAGHGRLRALKRLGIEFLRAEVREKFDLVDFAIENWRMDETPYGAAVLVEFDLTSGMSVADVAKKFSISPSLVYIYSDIVRNLNKDLKKRVRDRTMTMDDAHTVSKLPVRAQAMIVREISEPTKMAVKRAVENVAGVIAHAGAKAADTIAKFEEVKEKAKKNFDSTRDAFSILGTHWAKSVGELRLLHRVERYRKLFILHAIDLKPILE